MTNKENTKTNTGIFSFFAGAGFLDLGFENTEGFETVFVNEYDKHFMEVYKASRKELKVKPPMYGYSNDDICDLLESQKAKTLKENIQESKRKFDLVGFIGGPPCPDFSVGGKNKGFGGENGRLSATYVELIIKNRPDFFLFENVKGLYRTKKHRAFFDEMKLKLISNGYHLTERLINAIEFGAPQDRERIILVGFKLDVLTDLRVELSNSSILKSFDWTVKAVHSARDILAKDWPQQEPFLNNEQRPMPKGINKKLTVQYWFDKNDVEEHPNANHYFQPRAGLPKFLSIQEGDDLKKSYKRLHRWRYSPTAAYGNNEVHLHPYKPRRISVAEALAIQSLPKNFIIPGHIALSHMFKTIGNGVPYLASKGLAETISTFIEESKSEVSKYAEIISK